MPLNKMPFLIFDAGTGLCAANGAIFAEPFYSCSSKEEVSRLLNDESIAITGVLLGVKEGSSDWLEMTKLVAAHHPTTPIYIVIDRNAFHYSQDVLGRLHIAEVLEGPVGREQVESLLPTRITSAKYKDPTALEHEHNYQFDATSMYPLTPQSLFMAGSAIFDIYVKIGENRFVKILKSGDAIDADRIESYIKKQVKSFYIKNDERDRYVHFCDDLATALLEGDKPITEEVQQQVSIVGTQAYNALRDIGVEEKNLHLAKRFVAHTRNMLRKMPLDNLPSMQNWIKRLEKEEHSVGTAMIVSVILQALQYKDVEVIEMIMLSSFLHDIGLFMLNEDFTKTAYADLTPEQKIEYEKHPILGANAIAEIPGIQPLVVQAVAQHHERRSGKGFPKRLGSGSISQVAEIIGIADTFHDLMLSEQANPAGDALARFENDYFDEFSYPTIEAFRKAFLMKPARSGR